MDNNNQQGNPNNNVSQDGVVSQLPSQNAQGMDSVSSQNQNSPNQQGVQDAYQQTQSGSAYNQGQNVYSQNQVYQQQPQVVVPSPSPEVPSVVKTPEVQHPVEQTVETDNSLDIEGSEKKKETVEEKEERIDGPEVIPNIAKFESPFRVYGYDVSGQIKNQKNKDVVTKVLGDTSVAKTWLIVLVGRLLRMYNTNN